MSFNRQSEIKLSQFREDIKNEKIFERKMNYLIKNEFDATLNDILQLEPDSFIERIEKGISQRNKQIATEMNKQGLSVEMISTILKLSKEEVEKLLFS